MPSGPYINNGFEVNRRIVFVMRLLGIVLQGINLFSNLMDLGEGLSKTAYDSILEHIHQASKIYFSQSCNKAVEEEKKLNEQAEVPLLEMKVSGDGSWKKRGFSSKIGVTTLILYRCGKIVDLVVKSTFCQGCLTCPHEKDTQEYIDWYENHTDECSWNHEGSAGKMEVDSVIEMFERSWEYYGIRYTVYIGDGDSKTFIAILRKNPYADEFQVIKCECIGHVQKRIGTRLRNLKKNEKLGGRGKLTDGLIKQMSTYYGLAIRRNINSVTDMRAAVLATYYHLCSTDENPHHEYCPPGAESWCEWQASLATGANYTHPPALHADLQ